MVRGVSQVRRRERKGEGGALLFQERENDENDEKAKEKKGGKKEGNENGKREKKMFCQEQ